MRAINQNGWTGYGVVAQEPVLKKLSDNKVMAFTVLISESAGQKTYLPVYAFNEKAHIMCSLAHKGSVIFAKGIFKTKVQTTRIQAKVLIGLFLKINEFEVLLKEPIRVDEIDFANTVALFDPDNFMEEEESVK